MNHTAEIYYHSPIGIIEIKANEKGICGLNFVEKEGNNGSIYQLMDTCMFQLDEYFKGTRTTFDLALSPEGTDFQNRVWQELLKIPYGKTVSYLDIAHSLGDRNKIRAVGNANGKNKISIIIPCHRVIGSNNALTGYAGGLWRKRWLLDFESRTKQGELF